MNFKTKALIAGAVLVVIYLTAHIVPALICGCH